MAPMSITSSKIFVSKLVMMSKEQFLLHNVGYHVEFLTCIVKTLKPDLAIYSLVSKCDREEPIGDRLTLDASCWKGWSLLWSIVREMLHFTPWGIRLQPRYIRMNEIIQFAIRWSRGDEMQCLFYAKVFERKKWRGVGTSLLLQN